jgi:hypothetical protein
MGRDLLSSFARTCPAEDFYMVLQSYYYEHAPLQYGIMEHFKAGAGVLGSISQQLRPMHPQ